MTRIVCTESDFLLPVGMRWTPLFRVYRVSKVNGQKHLTIHQSHTQIDLQLMLDDRELNIFMRGSNKPGQGSFDWYLIPCPSTPLTSSPQVCNGRLDRLDHSPHSETHKDACNMVDVMHCLRSEPLERRVLKHQCRFPWQSVPYRSHPFR